MAQDRNTQRSQQENTGNQQKGRSGGRQSGKPQTTETGGQNNGGQTHRADDSLKKDNRKRGGER